MTETRSRGETLELRLHRIEQLFSSLDPAPFSEKDLDPAAERFILEWAEEPDRARGELCLRIWLDEGATLTRTPSDVEQAIQNFFGMLASSERSRLRLLIRDGQISLGIGLVFITLCLAAAGLLQERSTSNAFLSALSESLIVAGWVGMWRPIQLALYDWWPIRRRIHVRQRLARARVEVRGPSVSVVRGP